MILCCGEALADMIERDTVGGQKGFVPYAGGAVFNTAIGLGRLGVPAGIFTGLSNDMFGTLLNDTLAASHVDTSLSPRFDRPSTLAFVKLVNGNAKYSFVDEGTAGRMLSVDDLPSLDKSFEALHFGAISLIFEPCGSTFEALMAREYKNRVISLDPNIRPGFIKDEDAHRARILRMAAMADIIKVSDEDLDWIAKGTDAETVLSTWLEQGTSLILITRGGDGADAITHQGRINVPITQVKVVDTIGAGDTFNAGLLEWLRASDLLNKSALKTLSLKQAEAAVKRGAAVAAITVSRAGADAPWASELPPLVL